MHVVILAKAVPNTAEALHLGADMRIDRSALDLVLNPNDEVALEVALRLAESDPEVRTTMLSMSPETGWPGLSKAIAAGIERAVLVSDGRLQGSCILSTVTVLAAALAREPFDLVLGGQDSSDGGGGVVLAAVATLMGLPLIGQATSVTVVGDEVHARVERDDGVDLIAAPLPALVSVTHAAGPFRYPNLRSILATRSHRPEMLGLEDLGLDPDVVGARNPTTRVLGATLPEPRQEARVIGGDVRDVARAVADFLAERGVLP